ncbi:unnamed protein product [Echinostoma caproni]|uniref:Myb-like DNA-binding domain protein n=1 Tax=Echinostoma caproni TaxID=27848 RepID=A0A183AH91_9TREM|nr:unnamed protein product [Echinostoma caproni]
MKGHVRLVRGGQEHFCFVEADLGADLQRVSFDAVKNHLESGYFLPKHYIVIEFNICKLAVYGNLVTVGGVRVVIDTCFILLEPQRDLGGKSELVALARGVARCARDRQIALLSTQRDILLRKLAASKLKQSDSSNEPSSSGATADLLAKLRSIEDRLDKFRSLPQTPPKRLFSALTSVSVDANYHSIGLQTTEMETVWKERIFEGYHGPKFIREHHAQTWRELLTSAEDLLRSSEWQEIAATDVRSSVSPTNLRLIWFHRLRPQLNHGNWTEEEDFRLVKLVEQHGQRGKWDKIAEELDTGRTAFSCLQRWQTKHNREFQRGRPWTAEEDTALLDILKRLLEHYPPTLIDWQVVAAFHTTRAANECRARANVISPVFSTFPVHCFGSKISAEHNRDIRPYTLRPFTPNEDLQLLMSIQRYGLAGGKLGSGGGVGVGSWAVVCSALPGRSLRTCQNRYLELCEQFQPWTYSEDRRLYQMRLQLEPNACVIQKKEASHLRPFTKLVKHFPGRSLLSLRHRFLLLYRYSRIWGALREVLNQQSRTVEDDSWNVIPDSDQAQTSLNTEQCDGVPLTAPEMRQLLLYSPFTCSFVSRLRKQGISNPEAEALRLLMNWKNDGSQMTSVSGIPLTVDSEFCLLLRDLANDQLIPCPLVADLPQQPKENHSSLVEVEDQFKSVIPPSLFSSRRIISLVLLLEHRYTYRQETIILFLDIRAVCDSDCFALCICLLRYEAPEKNILLLRSPYRQISGKTKNFLLKPVRRCLLLSFRRFLVRGSKLSRVLQPHNIDAIVESTEILKELMHVTKSQFRVGTWERANAIVHLLSDRHRFGVTLDKVLRQPKTARALAAKNTMAGLPAIAPLVASQMVRQVCADKRHTASSSVMALGDYPMNQMEHEPSTSFATDAEGPTVNVGTDVDSVLSHSNVPKINVPTARKRSVAYSMGGGRGHRLLEIRRLLDRIGPNGQDIYLLGNVGWINEKDRHLASALTKRETSHMPLMLRELPIGIGHDCYRDDRVVSGACHQAAISCVRDALGLFAVDNCGSTQTVDGKAIRSVKTRILPPNYATLFMLKSLLSNIPQLVRRSENYFTNFVRTR